VVSFAAIARRRASTLGLACLAAVLGLPCVQRDLAFDDYIMALVVRAGQSLPGIAVSRFDLFAFAGAYPSQNHELIEQGLMLPWWSDEALRIVFFRPLASLSHYLDYLLWPEVPELMYLHSLLWLAAVVWAVATFYRQLAFAPARSAQAPEWRSLAWALLSGLIFAVNETNGAAVSWLSNRNLLMGTFWGVVALSLHVRARSQTRQWSVGGAICFALSLGSGEVGVGLGGYFASYALLRDRGSLRCRLRALVPYLIVFGSWFAIYAKTGAGIAASGVYLQPVGDWSRFMVSLPGRLAALGSALVGPVPADVAFFGSEPMARIGFVLSAGLAALLAYGVWCTRRDGGHLGFWALGTVGALLPVAASFPSDRLLIPANIGASALLGHVLLTIGIRVRQNLVAGRRLPGVTRGLGVALAINALVLPAVLFPVRAYQMRSLVRAASRAVAVIDTVADLEQKHVLLLGGPSDFLVGYVPAERTWKGLQRAKSWHWVAAGEAEVELRTIDERHLLFTRPEGFFATALHRLYRREAEVDRGGEYHEFGAAAVWMRGDGVRTTALELELPERFRPEDYVFLRWTNDRYEQIGFGALAPGGMLRAPSVLEFALSPWFEEKT
jgi:hypothetical protein